MRRFLFAGQYGLWMCYDLNMVWFILAATAPLIWSFLNHADKYLVSKFPSISGVGGLITFSSLFPVLFLPVILFFDHTLFTVPSGDRIILALSGVAITLGNFFAMKALEKDDPSYVVPFWQLSPVFAYILGYFFLGEILSRQQILGGIIIIAGAAVLSLEFERDFRPKFRPVLLMTLSSLCFAISDTLFKKIGADTSFISSFFWNQIGVAAFGLAFFLCVRRYREDALRIILTKHKSILGINIATELLLVIANAINYFAMLLAPISLVLLVNYSSQPLFVFTLGLVLSLYFPHILTEKIARGHLAQKLLCIAIMGVGIYMIYNV